ASIDEINAVRKHISLSKGGQMARASSLMPPGSPSYQASPS
ncbi:MAG: DUF4147 domain-containing protein, partial [Desulfobacteraceae bacterium]|nr:DUF4147 domain-containing protein [Desulfobacteraceae bacterium]